LIFLEGWSWSVFDFSREAREGVPNIPSAQESLQK